MKHSKSRVQTVLKLLIITTLMFSFCTCDKSTEPIETKSNLMIVYPNSGPNITLVDYNTFEIVKEIEVILPDTLNINKMCLSSNHDYFIFITSTGEPKFSSYIVTYDISKDVIENIFPTGLDSVGAPRLSAAYIPEEPGLIYLYTHSIGLFSIDFFSEEIKLISDEHDQGLGKFLYFTSDKQLAVILEQHGGNTSYAEVEFYDAHSGLTHPEFILNEHNQDSIFISDMVFAHNESEILVSLRLPGMRYIANNFGSYNLHTKKLYKSSITLPWSLNPYYLAYSPRRNECYTVGAQDTLYIIGVDSLSYYIKSKVALTGKINGPSRILVRPDENIAFVSCAYTDAVFVIDLESRQALTTIPIESAYLMLLF